MKYKRWEIRFRSMESFKASIAHAYLFSLIYQEILYQMSVA